MAYDPNSPATSHSGEADVDQIRENFAQLRKLEISAADPANPVAGMLHVHTGGASPVLRQRNTANNAWIDLYDLTAQKLLIDADTLDGKHASEIGVQANTVGTGELKTALGAVSGLSGNFVLPGGQYSFYPQIKCTSAIDVRLSNGIDIMGDGVTYLTSICAMGGGSTFYAQNRYVTASGTEYWIFLLVEKASGKVVGGFEAPDHPCYGNGGDPGKVPHPFIQYWGAPLPEDLEIVLLDMQSTRAVLSDAINGQRALDLIHGGAWLVDMSAELPFAPRDMDGKQMLNAKHGSYAVRRAVRAA